jgi:hypothetical protein
MPFDLETYKQRAGRVALGGIDVGAFVAEPLDPSSLRCLRYMHDVEHHTICYLRDLLVTRSHRDPEMTTFLTMWAFEEYWHGEAIGSVLAAHGERSGPARIAPMRRALRAKDRLAPLLHGLGSALAGRSFSAIHMTWGAVNEWTTQGAYGRLSARAGHPVLTELLGRIMRQEGRHIDFYATQAARLLDGDTKAQRLTRLALRRFWNPVGSDVMPDTEVRFLAHHLFDGEDGRAVTARIDRRIDRLPGLEGLRLLEGSTERLAA